jgi:hypothetical protein
MSEVYEGIIVLADKQQLSAALDRIDSPLEFAFGQLDGNVFAIYRTASRQAAFAAKELEEVAQEISTAVGACLAVFYDNRTGLRESALFRRGECKQRFTEADELWVLLDERGEPMLDGEKFPATSLDDDEEYDCVFTAIDAGLHALGVEKTVNSASVKQAFCYEFNQ